MKKGSHHTEEAKRINREKHLGRKHSEEHKEKIRQKMLGRTYSRKTLRKMSKSAKNRKYTEEGRKKISESKKKYFKEHPEKVGMKGCHHTEKTKKKMSKLKKGKPGNPHTKESKEKITKSLKGVPLTEERINNMIKGQQKSNHKNMIRKNINSLKKRGFRCIVVDNLRPDIIAFKDGKTYAVEVEMGSQEPNWNKYNNSEFYDDIIWLIYCKKTWFDEPKNVKIIRKNKRETL